MARKGSAQEILERRRQAWDLRVREHLTEEQIAARLDVAQSTISRDLAATTQTLAAGLKAEAEARRALQVAQLEAIGADALAEYQRSKQDAEVYIESDGPNGSTTRTERRGRLGDAALLSVALKALADVRALLGLDAPKRAEVTGRDGQPIEVTTLTFEQAVRLLREQGPPPPVETEPEGAEDFPGAIGL